MKPKLAPRAAPSAGGTGLTPSPAATAIITGTTTLADAVFDEASESRMPATIAMAVSAHTPSAPEARTSARPTAAASPVKHEVPEREAAAEEQNRPPVD